MEEIPQLNKKELRDFGLIAGTIVAVLFGLLLPWLRGHTVPLSAWIIAGVLWVLAALVPTGLGPVYQVWMRIGLVLGWVNTRIILGTIFFALMMPMGAIMRLFNQDPMARKFDANLKTYCRPSQEITIASMEKPF
ncbi:sxtJ [Planktothrix sp. FACHB-1355]|uniref:SxtJ n=1 Tax=Aerosakkonema funiforme FACHB-1375 TaxID=2949571 RepID=A0A926VG57_9CYAN|nr:MULTISPECIES: SxtJ family membrane protein [Oscillatoriales]MBD2182039.1 sxtJ [Aerosakkonema funiforme FACHB-1375]MBD3559120.1 sxtJ [Planktothrix sp. FACHB-1355]